LFSLGFTNSAYPQPYRRGFLKPASILPYEGSEKVQDYKKAKMDDKLAQALRDADELFFVQQHQQETVDRRKRKQKSAAAPAAPAAAATTSHKDDAGGMIDRSAKSPVVAEDQVMKGEEEEEEEEEEAHEDDDDQEEEQRMFAAALSDYEARRLQNIRENSAMLAKLGLDAPIVNVSGAAVEGGMLMPLLLRRTPRAPSKKPRKPSAA
jgi:hypothetical protein